MTDLTDIKVLAQKVLDIKESVQAKKDAVEAARQTIRDIQSDDEDDRDRLKEASLSLQAALAPIDKKFMGIVSIDLGSKVLVCEGGSDGWFTKIAQKI